ncbi:MAG: response regulator [Methanomicrobiales archaeon]|nr:response regulator [Methanomicrobiales archaeon]
MRAKILVVEDEFITAADIQNNLQEMGFDVPISVDNGETAIQKAGELMPDLILMDITLMGKMNGIEAAERIRELYGIPVIFLTAHSEQLTVQRSLSSNPYGYIIKPFEPSNLRVSIEMALYKHDMEERLMESERTINCLLNAIPDALALLNREKKIVAVNEAMAKKLGTSHQDLTGTAITNLIQAGALRISSLDLDLLFHQRTPVRFEEEHDGRHYQTAMYPIMDTGGGIARIAIQSHDITDLKYVEEMMKTVGLSQIEQNLKQFLILNDGIRNPLQVIAGYADLSDNTFRSQIDEQIQIINNLVSQLDKGWIESEKVRSFLIRHYQHGEKNPREKGDITDQ